MLADSSATVYIAGILGIGDLPTVTQQQRWSPQDTIIQGDDDRMNGVQGKGDEIQTFNQNFVATGIYNIWLITGFVLLLQR